jgi:hypothetical protein
MTAAIGAGVGSDVAVLAAPVAAMEAKGVPLGVGGVALTA